MASVLTARPDTAAVDDLEAALAHDKAGTISWDTRAALLWTLIILERFDTVEAALPGLIDASRREGSARGLIAVYSSLAFQKYRLGALPEADVAARLALQVLRDGDFAPGLGVGAIVAGIAIESGDLEDAQAILDATPPEPPGVISVLAPAARGRLALARGDGERAAANFAACLAMFASDVWGMEIRDVGYLHARSGAAEAQLLLGERATAIELADSELADARGFARPRALGIALRVAGLAHGGRSGRTCSRSRSKRCRRRRRCWNEPGRCTNWARRCAAPGSASPRVRCWPRRSIWPRPAVRGRLRTERGPSSWLRAAGRAAIAATVSTR
jgi:hypothetical protein